MQKRYAALAATLLGLSLTSAAQAALLMENKGPKGKVQKVYMDDAGVRMESGKPGQYMLIQFADKKMYAVNSEQKQILDMSAKPPTPPKMPEAPKQAPPQAEEEVKTELVKKGDGPEIAGFSTVHYQVMANGQVCSNEYLSADALQLPHIKTFMQTMQDLAAERKKQRGGMPFMRSHPCVQATEEASAQYLKLGMPVRSTNPKDELRHELVSIQKDVAAPEGGFNLPQGYQMSTPFDMMKQAMERARQQGGGQAPQMPPPAPPQMGQ